MKIVRFLGGLGNQMFQYAFYKALEKKGFSVYADLSFFKNYTLHNGYELNRIFDIRVNNAPRLYIELLRPNQQKWIYKKFKRILLLKKSYREEIIDFNFDSSFLNRIGSHYYWGYWQNEKYFKEIKEDLHKDFEFKTPLKDKNLEISKLINFTQSVSIHVRRGDYVNHPVHGNICDKDYYISAIKLINQKISDLVYFIFSDDIKWCHENLNIKNAYYIDWNIGSQSYIDMQLMSLCKNQIIANSTFSWWAAWLNKNKSKIVISPKIWLNNNLDASDITLQEWYKI
jgi:hypothetical protein